jgi:IS5 family transposase
MHQTCKGKQWFFGMKAHIGVDSKQGIVHSVCSTAASVADKHMLPEQLHGEERKVCHPTDEDPSAGARCGMTGLIRGRAKLSARRLRAPRI